MKNNNVLQNAEAISELGLLTSAYLKLQKMPIISDNQLAAYQQSIQHWNLGFNSLVTTASDEIAKIVRNSRKVNKIVFAGYEAILMDKVVKQIDKGKKIIVIPNNPLVNRVRIEMNHADAGSFSVHEIYPAWEITGHDTIVFVPFFQLIDGSIWVYRYCSPIVNERLFSKARTIIGISLLKEIQIEPGYDTRGALTLLAEANPEIFQRIISIEPQTFEHDLDKYTHPA